jgi:hypothetical protein
LLAAQLVTIDRNRWSRSPEYQVEVAEGLMAYPVGRWIDQGRERMVMTIGSILVGIFLALLVDDLNARITALEEKGNGKF